MTKTNTLFGIFLKRCLMRYSEISKKIFPILLVAVLSSCNAQKATVDLIIHNAKIYTVDSLFSVYNSMAINNGKIKEIGDYGLLSNKYLAKETINANGKFVYPGFIDAHCHFYYYGQSLQKADLVGTKSFDEVIERVKKHHTEHPSEWILGRGWDQNDWPEKSFPDKSKLDETFPNNPVILTRIDGHAVIANSEALKRGNVSAKSKIKGGDVITKNNEPTGVLIDNAIRLVYGLIPSETKEQIQQILLDAQKKCFAVGLTSIHDAGLTKNVIDNISELQDSGKLKMRVYAMLSDNIQNYNAFMKKGLYKTDFLNIRAIKLFADGALGSRGAALIKPYTDDTANYGLIVTKKSHLEDICKKAYGNNYQVCTHAIGDSANRLMLNIYAGILKGKNDRRWRIEHSQVIHPDDFRLFSDYSIIPSVQPTHATSDMYWAAYRLGEERAKGAYAYKKLLAANGWLPSGSDFPVENINPLYGFYAAVSRKDQKGFPEGGFQSENALSREEALRAMTIWAAKAAFEENEKGSLEPGKLADFVITDKDLMTAPENELFKIKVLSTFVGGQSVYKY